MKHIWVIDTEKYNLFEGYVMDDYKDVHDTFACVYSDEYGDICLGSYEFENIFDNKLTALRIYEEIIRFERKRIYREINKLNRKSEILFEKLLNIHNL